MNLTLKVEVTEATHEAVTRIEDLNGRVAWFLEEQAALEQWRSERQRNEDRDLAAAIIREADEAKRAGVPREEVAARLLARWDRIFPEPSE